VRSFSPELSVAWLAYREQNSPSPAELTSERPAMRDLVTFYLCASLVAFLYCNSVALAALTPIKDSPDFYDEPNLIGVNPYPENANPSVLETLYGESNLRRVDDREDVAFRHTGVEAIVTPVARFDGGGFALFYIPNASKVSFLGELLTDGGPGSSGFSPAVPPASIPIGVSGEIFGFQSHRQLYSDPVFNLRDLDCVVTYEIIGNNGRETNVVGNYVMCWDNSENGDRDFQDAVFEISGVVSVPSLSADFNGDLRVDAADLSAWGAGFGISSNAKVQEGDANRDHKVDGRDFLIWQRSYLPNASSLTVPEPTAPLLLACAALVGLRRRSLAF
jgi:hypothetical protein